MGNSNNSDDDIYSKWNSGIYRVFCAFSSAVYLSYGMTGEQIETVADYLNLISHCMETIAQAIDEDESNEDDFVDDSRL